MKSSAVLRRAAAVFSALSALLCLSANALAQEPPPLIYSLQFEELEYRIGSGSNQLAWNADAFVGSDIWKLRWQSEAEYALDPDSFERLENQLIVQRMASEFFDVKAGVRFDTPEGHNRTYGVLGLHGLAPQWFELDADAFLSGKGDASARLDLEYELLITNRVILTPSAEINVAFSDDEAMLIGSGLSFIELGARLSYDLIDRTVSPYVGVAYERAFGQTADYRKADGEDTDEVFLVLGMRLLF